MKRIISSRSPTGVTELRSVRKSRNAGLLSSRCDQLNVHHAASPADETLPTSTYVQSIWSGGVTHGRGRCPYLGCLIKQADFQICTGTFRQLEHVIVNQYEASVIAQAANIGRCIVAVGAALGPTVGVAVGPSVGAALGLAVGASVGVVVGPAVGE